jgi:hypothetical protein
MIIKFNLNESVKKNIPKVEHVFLYDDDDNSLLMGCVIEDPRHPGANINREVGMITLNRSMAAQVSVYDMPNGKYCAVAYPCSVKVDYDKFEEEMRKIFKHVNKPNTWSKNSYAFYLFCVRNGYKSLIKK